VNTSRPELQQIPRGPQVKWRAKDQMNWLGLDTMRESPWAEGARYVFTEIHDDGSARARSLGTLDDVARVIACDGKLTALVYLKDGRYVAWESWEDATGSGFHEEAYGGNVEVTAASSPLTALLTISEQAREGLVYDVLECEQPLIAVLHDAFYEQRSRRELCQNARESGEFGELAEHRVDALIREWARHEAARDAALGARGEEFPSS
jgi:hypothetical protein